MEDKKEFKTKGRVLEGEELKEHLKAFSDIEESINKINKEYEKNERSC